MSRAAILLGSIAFDLAVGAIVGAGTYAAVTAAAEALR